MKIGEPNPDMQYSVATRQPFYDARQTKVNDFRWESVKNGREETHTYMYVHTIINGYNGMFVCVHATSTPCLQKPEKALDPLFLELLTTVSSFLWVLGIKPSSSGKAASS